MRKRGPYRKPELDEAYEMVTAGGLSLAEAARRLGRNQKALSVALRRHLGYKPDPSPRFRGAAVILPTRPAAGPTDARPGSEEKIAELCRRYQAGEALFHPADNRVPLLPFYVRLRNHEVETGEEGGGRCAG